MRISDWSSDVCSSDLFTRKGWLAVIDTNLNGTWWMMQEAAKRWRTDGTPGNIINIVANVERGMPQAAHTCAARAGVIYLSKTLATEWAPPNVRVKCIGPGRTEESRGGEGCVRRCRYRGSPVT